MRIDRFGILARSIVGLALLAVPSLASSQTSPDRKRVKVFESQVDEFRARLGIPGLSAIIIKDQRVVWTRGFGLADVENRIAATPDTLYHIASMTKPIAATLVMQFVEQGKLDLDEPMSRYSSDFKDDSVRIKHILSMTSEEPPGERYQYDGNRYDYLTAVIEKKSGKPFREVLVKAVLDPLGMSASVPVHDIVDEAQKWTPSLGKANLDRYRKNLSRLAQPYTLYGAGEVIHAPYPPRDSIGAAAGLLSTVKDMAKFDVAIDRHVFLKKETQEKAWTAFVSNGGQRLPYGLGWFVTEYRGQKLIWHYGNWGTGFSSIHIKVPEKNASLIMLSNSEALSGHQFKGNDDLMNNAFACAFLRLFVFETAQDDCEQASRAAMEKWREDRRANARVAIRVARGILDAYVGRYQFETFPRILTVHREGDRLFADTPKGSKAELFAESESEFFIKTRHFKVTFAKEAGRVTHMDVVDDNGETYRAKRLE